MASISSIGVGSGLDVKSIVSQLVELEKKPLQKLEIQAATVNAKISAFGEVKSLVSTLSDAASKLTSVTGWNGVTTSSSDSTYVSATAVGGTLPTAFNVDVIGLAKAQSTASNAISGIVGTGTLKIELGKWDTVGTGTFTPKTPASSVDIAVSATDTVADIASKINGANAGVTATILTDASGQRLLLRGKNTGEEAGFNLTTSAVSGLERLATTAIDTTLGASETASNATAKVNGLTVTSSSNTFANTVAGVTFKAEKVTDVGKPIQISVAKDNSAVQANITAFVEAYNAVNSYLSEATKYDAGTKQAGLFQGDSTAVGLQNSLRAAMQSVAKGSNVYKTLSDIGVGVIRGGNLEVNSTKLSKALENVDEVKKMFRGSDAVASGLAASVKSLATDMLSTDGFFKTKDASLKLSLKRNTADQTQVKEKASTLETRLNARYSALDSKMATLNALNSYVSQQVTTWNKANSS
ncbi:MULTISPECIES: flagellar filament capping protein FliD [Giesbergeria]|uniref:Flagellar hook-associated protein 2 n=1 Tax=Giesbergeria sinuosa TaxID=80883 RepID=A0ABV9QEA2_9BURK